MGKIIALFCEETPGLKLGPGTTSSFSDNSEPGDVIVFSGGFATFDEDQFPSWEKWKDAPGTPLIRVVDEAAGEATSGDGVECPVCGRSFKTDFGLNSHLRSHAPKGETTSNPKKSKKADG